MFYFLFSDEHTRIQIKIQLWKNSTMIFSKHLFLSWNVLLFLQGRISKPFLEKRYAAPPDGLQGSWACIPHIPQNSLLSTLTNTAVQLVANHKAHWCQDEQSSLSPKKLFISPFFWTSDYIIFFFSKNCLSPWLGTIYFELKISTFPRLHSYKPCLTCSLILQCPKVISKR